MSLFLILVNTFGALLLLASLPLLVELLILSGVAALPLRRRSVPAAATIRLAVIIPAHNEEVLIGSCVRSIVAAGLANLTIYVIAHNCSDATVARAREAGAHVFTLRDGVGGKGTALEFGFTEAVERGAEALLVVDADSIVGEGMMTQVAAAFSSGVQALQCRYEVGNGEANPRTRLAALALLGMNVLRPLGRARLGLSCGIFGNGFGVRTEVLARVPYVAHSLVEDLEYHLHLIRAGVRVHFLREVAVFGEMPETSAAAWSQRSRWEGGRIRMRRLWTKPLAGLILRGYWRAVEPLLDLLALPLGDGVALLGLALVLGVISGSIWLVVFAALGSLTVAFYLGVAATLGPQPGENLRALAAAPGYLLWKLLLLRKTRSAARSDAAWVRTTRNGDSSGELSSERLT